MGVAFNDLDPGCQKISIRQVDAESLPEEIDKEHWSCSAAALTPGGIRTMVRDRRWCSVILVAELQNQPVGLLPVLRMRTHDFGADIYNPTRLAPDLFPGPDTDARDFLFIGGGRDLVSGFAIAAWVADSLRGRVARSMVGAAFDLAAGYALTGAALYVRDADLASLRAGPDQAPPAAEIAQSYSLAVADGGDDGYLASLNASRRSVVKRDWRGLDSARMRARRAPAASMVDRVIELVGNVKRRHDLADPPMLIRWRLQSWLRFATDPMAFWIPDDAGNPAAVSLASTVGDCLEMYEIGLLDDWAHRQLAYAEVLVYAPLRYATDHGLARVSLGLGSERPKQLRGAVAEPVWALAATPPEFEHPTEGTGH
jgi:hypothetical protein